MPRLEMQPCSRGARRSLPLFGPAGGRRAAAQARPAVTGTDTQKLAAGHADGRRDRDEFSRRLDKCLNPGFTPWKFDSQVQETRPTSPHRARGAIDRRIATPGPRLPSTCAKIEAKQAGARRRINGSRVLADIQQSPAHHGGTPGFPREKESGSVKNFGSGRLEVKPEQVTVFP